MTLTFAKLPVMGRFLLSTICFIAITSLSGCLNTDDEPIPLEVAYVSFYHASPDTDTLNIVVGNSQINNAPFTYQKFSGYLSFYAGQRTLKFTDTDDNDPVILETTVNLVKDKYYSFFIADSLASIEAVVLGDSAEAPGASKAMVRFVHLSPDSPEVSVFADDEALFSASSFKAGTAFKEVDAGTFTLEFRNTANEEVLLTSPGVEIKSQNYYTIILNGFLAPPQGNTNELSSDVVRN